MKHAQPWINNKWTEVFFILLPPFISLLIIILLPGLFKNDDGMTDAWWVALILLIDVAHVYSTLYRTYFDRSAFNEHRNKLLIIPFLSFTAGVLLYNFNALIFWRVLAYVAVFHFVRQQYGFMRIYSRKENAGKWSRIIDAVTIYTATLYPILYWHLSANRNFNWFVKGDFLLAPSSNALLAVFTSLYLVILAVYCVKETVIIYRNKIINIPRNAVIAGTVLSWYFGIIYFNGDMAFTLLNVVSHGIPYMALVWMYGKKSFSFSSRQSRVMQLVFSRYGLLLFLGIIFLFAYVEEGLWDITLWKEHNAVFGFVNLQHFKPGESLLSIIVPLLAVPQLTHYIIDGFVWRIKKNDLEWAEEHTG